MSFPNSFIAELHARAEAQAQGVADYLRQSRPCTSPIEELFLTAFYLAGTDAGGVTFGEPTPEAGDAWFFVKQQEPIREYRADFVIGLVEYPAATRIVVECDGHDYHERTKEQAARDRQRDRVMQRDGFKVLRFTGAEIYRNAFKCAEEVIGQAFLIHNQAREDGPNV